MPHSYCICHMHIVFSTKGRMHSISQDLQESLSPYMGGIARANKMIPLEIGGVTDHVHLLLTIPAIMPVSKAVQLIKGGSSKWIHGKFPEHHGFEWQEGYGAFSVSVSGIDATRAYIRNQAEHHRKVSFQEEYRGFLKAHGSTLR